MESRAIKEEKKESRKIPRIYRIKDEVLQEGYDPCFAFIQKIEGDIIRYSIAFPFGHTLTFNKEDSYTDKRENFFLVFRKLIGSERNYRVRLIG